MRTTVTLDDDVAAAVDQLRRSEHVGVSEALNRIARRGLAAQPSGGGQFVQKTYELGLRIDVRNVWEAIEQLEQREAADRT